MMSVAFLFAAAVFSGGRLEKALRGILVAGVVFVVVFFVALSILKYDLVAFEVTILTINWIVLIVLGVLLSVVFRRSARAITTSTTAEA